MKVIAIALAPYNELLVQFQFHVTSSQLLTSLATGNQEKERSSPAEREIWPWRRELHLAVRFLEEGKLRSQSSLDW